MRKQTIFACLLVALAVTGTTAGAASLLTGAQVKNGSLSSQDIKVGGIVKNRLSAGVQHLLEQVGKTGPTGPAGAAGAKGATGAAGPSGATGLTGPAGQDAVTRITSLTTGPWSALGATVDDPPAPDAPTPVIVANGAQLGPYVDGNQYSRILFDGLPAGTTMNDLSDLSYTESYTQDPDQHAGAPYISIRTKAVGDAPGDDEHHINFVPNSQPDSGLASGRTQTWDVTKGGLFYDDDGGDNPAHTWNQIIAAHGTDTIDSIRIYTGPAGEISNHTTALVQSVTIRALGFPLQQFDFGS